METIEWYATLIKPAWAPPSWIFGPVWSILYTIIAITYGYTLVLFLKGKISFRVLLPFILNIIFNLAFTPLQFGLQNNFLDAIDILLVFATLVWLIIVIYHHARWVSYANIPYLLWVTFAMTLQFTITYLNL